MESEWNVWVAGGGCGSWEWAESMGAVSRRWMWMESMGVASGCGCVSSGVPTFCSFFNNIYVYTLSALLGRNSVFFYALLRVLVTLERIKYSLYSNN